MKRSLLIFSLIVILALFQGCSFSFSVGGQDDSDEKTDEIGDDADEDDADDADDDDDAPDEDAADDADDDADEEVEPTDITQTGDYEISATSVLKDTTGIGFNYDETMAVDRDFSTSWCADTENDENPAITFDFDETVKANNLGIVPGYARDEYIYNQNQRVKKLKLSFDGGGSDIVTLEDEYKMHFTDLNGRTFKSVTFEVLETFEGDAPDADICIAEIDFWSDYVVNSDSTAAMNYYKNYKENEALRPNDIISSVSFTDAGMDRCNNPLRSDKYTETEGIKYFWGGNDILATGTVNEFGKKGDTLEAKLYKARLDSDPEGIMMHGEIVGWDFLFTVNDVSVVETCNGKLVANAAFDFDEMVDKAPFVLGDYKMEFVKRGQVIATGRFGVSQ